MRFKKSNEEEIRLSIAPLIDIVFLLLIFFMVTSHFDVASGVQIRLPKVAQKIFGEETSRIILLMDNSGDIYLEGNKIEMETLKTRLEEIVKEKESVHLVLQADKDARHGRVVETMDLAKAAGVRSIIIAAQWKSGKVF
jgi:biopolymer transport protein ExbD